MERKMPRALFLFVVLVVSGYLCGLASAARAQDDPGFQVVVNSANAAESLTARQVSSFLLRKSKSWSDGVAVEPVDLPASSEIRESFSRAVHKKSVSAVRAHWNQQIFSGLGVPPPSVESESEVLEYVRTHPGAIGYVGAGTALGTGVKAVRLAG